jgi:hypothetical protein
MPQRQYPVLPLSLIEIFLSTLHALGQILHMVIIFPHYIKLRFVELLRGLMDRVIRAGASSC